MCKKLDMFYMNVKDLNILLVADFTKVNYWKNYENK